MTPAGAVKNKKRQRLIVVAAAALAAFLYLRNRAGAAPAIDASMTPVATDGTLAGGSSAGATDGSSAATAAALEGLSSLNDIPTQLSNFEASVNDRFGHFQDLEDAYGQLKQGNDPFAVSAAAVTTTDSSGLPASTGAGDATNFNLPPAAPGNAKATARARAATAATSSIGHMPTVTTSIRSHLAKAPIPKATAPPHPIPVNHSPAPAPPKYPEPATHGAVRIGAVIGAAKATGKAGGRKYLE